MKEKDRIAARMRQQVKWNPDDCSRLCELAGLKAEFENSGESFQTIVEMAANKLGVEIYAQVSMI